MKSLPLFAKIGLNFDSTQDFDEVSIQMPENAKILSVKTKKNQSILWVEFTYPKIDFVSPYYNFHFIICKQKNNDVMKVAGHAYIGNIEVFGEAFRVFVSKSASKS